MIKILIMLFWAIVFYYIFKTVRAVYRLMMKASSMQNNNNNNYNQPNTDFGKNRQAGQNRYNINSKDIVDAEFTEIKPDDEDKKNNK